MTFQIPDKIKLKLTMISVKQQINLFMSYHSQTTMAIMWLKAI